MMNDHWDDEEDYEDGAEEDDGILLSFNDKGELAVHNPDDYVEMKKSDADLIKGFIEANKEAFAKYCKKTGAHMKKHCDVCGRFAKHYQDADVEQWSCTHCGWWINV